MHSIICLTAAALGGAAGVTEIPDSIEDSWTELDQIVVTGTRTPKLLKDSPILTRVITEKDIRRTDATDIADLLQAELPGIEFTFSMNQQVNLNMQGFGGNSVLFLVDGEKLAGETLDNVDYSRLDMNGVGKIEIVKGAASSLYGSNAVGGVVNIISREATEPWTLNVNARYGSHNDQRYGINGSFKAGIVGSTTSFLYSRTDNYNLPSEGDYTTYYGGYSYNFKERLTVTPLDGLKIIGRAGYFFRQRNSQPTLRDRYRDFSAGLRGLYDFSPANSLEVSYGFDQYDKSDYQLAAGLDVRKYRNVQHSLKAVYNHTFAGRHILTAGGDFMRDYLQSYQFTDNGHKSQITSDAFAQFDMNFPFGLNVIAGARYDYFSEAAMQHLSSKVSAMYKLDRWALRGSYSGGFRAPTLKEMYMDFDMAGIFMIYGNPDLKAESSHNFQLSAEYTRRTLNLSFGAFCNLVDNRITTAWNQQLNGQFYTNIGRVNIAGAEANASYRFDFGLGLRASYVYTHEHVKHGEPYTSSTRPHTATARVDYTKVWKNYSLTAALTGRALSAVDVDEFTELTEYESTVRVRYPAYSIWKLTLTQSFWRGIDLTVGIDNLFNYRPSYYYSNSPSTTGTTFTVGLSLDIDAMARKSR